jgi:DNA-binding transcriptional regulator YhcF (GntR family)
MDAQHGQPVEFTPTLSHESEVPLYRQLYEHIALRIRSGELARGERLPATRELAGLLGLNRTTVSAAYDALETDGLIAGQVGRGSFVTGMEPKRQPAESTGARSSTAPMPRPPDRPAPSPTIASFVMSRPSRELFPLDDFRASCQAVLSAPIWVRFCNSALPAGTNLCGGT